MKLLLFLIGSIGAVVSAASGQSAQYSFKLTSPDFSEGGKIPKKFTCDDQNVSPTLQIAGAPAGAKSLVLIVDDPDAPSGTFTHWLVWNLAPDTKEIASGAAPRAAVQGTND